MNPDLAHLVATESFRASVLLGNLIPVLKEHLPPSEYESFALAIAQCSAQISETLIERVFTEHPVLRAQADARVREYGRVF